MGVSILELVLAVLREEGFAADAAYPGQKFPAITGPVAAVHIEKVDRAGMTVTVEVNILCPASMGGSQCELEALRATEVLRWTGAVCVQNGCSYDGVAQLYRVAVLATFTAVTEADRYRLGPGFYVYLNDLRNPYVTGFTAVLDTGVKAEYAIGQANPAGLSRNEGLWMLQLEELVPAGSEEDAEPAADFELKVVTDAKTELYESCNWTEIRREYTRNGLRRVRKGFALDRREFK